MNYAGIIGTGSYVPEQIINNEKLEKIIDTNDEWITSRTGIKNRRISQGEDTSQLATKAALNALEDAKLTGEDIDLIIVATITPDDFTPSVACLVQDAIGAKNATCFDLGAACSGFVYALNVAFQFVKTGQCKNVLVVGAEVLSKVINWEDRNTCVLFGDGAGAAIVSKTEQEGLLSVYTGSKGDVERNLEIKAVGVKNPFCKEQELKPSHIKMNGLEIFKFATKIVRKSFKRLLADTQYSLNDVDLIIPHQANYRIIEHVAQKEKLDMDKFYVNLDKYGNTSSASIAIALDEVNKKELLKTGDKLMLVGFGGGLTWGALLLNWTK